MRVTIDRAGRVVIPEVVRTELCLEPGVELELTRDGAGLCLEPVGRQERDIEHRNGLPVLVEVANFVLTDDDVRALRDADEW
jgi:AbrB family looped-hinge helix DNA binding protein